MISMPNIELYPWRLRFVAAGNAIIAEALFKTREAAEKHFKEFHNRPRVPNAPSMYIFTDDMGTMASVMVEKIIVAAIFDFPALHKHNILCNTQLTVAAEQLEREERDRLDTAQPAGFKSHVS